MRTCAQHLVVCIVTIFAVTVPVAAAEFMPGYYISLNGDTVYGTVEFQSVYKRAAQCRFKPAGSDSTLTFSPSEIRGYRFTNGRYYVSKTVPLENGDQNIFIECLVEGYLSAFLYKDKNGEHYYLCRSDEKPFVVSFMKGLKYIEAKLSGVRPDNKEGWYYYRTLSHIPVLEKQLADVPALKSRIRRMKQVTRQSFTNLINDYNTLRCTSASSACVVYKTTEPSIRLAVEPAVGFIWFLGDDDTMVQTAQAGVICAISFPNSDMAFQLRTGLLFIKELKRGWGGSLFKIPLTFQYPFGYGGIQTRLHGGMNLFVGPPSNGPGIIGPVYTLSAGGDLQIKASQTLRFFIGPEIDFMPIAMNLVLYHRVFSIAALSLHLGASFQL